MSLAMLGKISALWRYATLIATRVNASTCNTLQQYPRGRSSRAAQVTARPGIANTTIANARKSVASSQTEPFP